MSRARFLEFQPLRVAKEPLEPWTNPAKLVSPRTSSPDRLRPKLKNTQGAIEMAREVEGGKTPMVTTRWWRLEPKWANLLTCFLVASALILTAKRVDSSYLKTFRSCLIDAKTLRLWPTDKFSPECGKDYGTQIRSVCILWFLIFLNCARKVHGGTFFPQ